VGTTLVPVHVTVAILLASEKRVVWYALAAMDASGLVSMVCLFVRGRRTGASAGRMSYYRRNIAGMGALAVLVGVRLVAHAY
jgi:hypothetical protein